jgi:hypothetical protein
MELTWEVGEISIVENKIVKFYRILAKLWNSYEPDFCT